MQHDQLSRPTKKKKSVEIKPHTIPTLVSVRAPAPAEAKFNPFVKSLLSGLRYGGINGNLANPAIKRKQFPESYSKTIIK